MISVVIPLYNKEKQIKSTLESVFRQTFQDFEIIIVNDGSTDGSVEEVKPFLNDKIRLINQENQGVSAARNRGIAEAKYDYIALLDADDEWKPDYLAAQVDLIQSFPECSVFACAYEFKDYKNNIKPLILNKIPFKQDKGVLSNYFEVAACSHPPLWTSAIVIKRETALSVGGFPVGVKVGEDLLTWAQLAVDYKIAYSLKAQAYFVQSISENYFAAPSRIPESEDIVGKTLAGLYEKHRDVRGLRLYISSWHKMRASMFLLLGQRRPAYNECIQSLKYNWKNGKIWIYLFLLLTPLSFRYKIFQKFGHT